MRGARLITIIGGGLAGLALGIGLRQKGVPVRVLEAGTYPRHRVCGEFIHGAGLGVLEGLDLKAKLSDFGAATASTAVFFSARRSSCRFALAPAACCISRYELDAWLAEEFCDIGGELCDRERWTSAVPEGWVLAAGRKAHPNHDGVRWIGLKAHVRGVALSADLEMHMFPEAYVGLCRLSQDEVNVCGLFRRSAGVALPPRPVQEELRGPIGSALRERLGGAEFVKGSFCAVAGLNLSPRRAREQAGCAIGDALTMIPPMTGNGMSMALESATIAVAPLMEYSLGQMSWATACETVSRDCDRAFARRLWWAERLHHLMFREFWRALIIPWAFRSAPVFNWMLKRTR